MGDSVVSPSQFVSNRILLLALLLLVFPSYGVYAGQSAIVVYSLIVGGLLFVWKWRWWWKPIRAFVELDEDAEQ